MPLRMQFPHLSYSQSLPILPYFKIKGEMLFYLLPFSFTLSNHYSFIFSVKASSLCYLAALHFNSPSWLSSLKLLITPTLLMALTSGSQNFSSAGLASRVRVKGQTLERMGPPVFTCWYYHRVAMLPWPCSLTFFPEFPHL